VEYGTESTRTRPSRSIDAYVQAGFHFLIERKDGITSFLELLLIACLVALVGKDLLDFNPEVIPSGREFFSAIQSHYFWISLKECGICALWNGTTWGGYPAMVEAYGAPLHPIIGICTLLWGVINGSKVAILVSLWFAGFAQWWIAKELELGRLARIWSALLVVAGGHLVVRMEGGAFTMLFSTALVSLMIPALLRLHRKEDLSSTFILSITTTSAILAGQGYMQLALVAAAPSLVFLLTKDRTGSKLWRKYIIAGGLAVVLAAAFLIPLLHFYPNIGKFEDPNFVAAQPLEYLPLNLVISDTGFLMGEYLGKLPAPNPYSNYIGWTSVIFAIVGLLGLKGEKHRALQFLFVGSLLVLIAASDVVVHQLVKVLPATAKIRFPTLISGLAVPMILGVAAYGLDHFWKKDWPKVSVRLGESSQDSNPSVSLKWLLIVPLILSLQGNVAFAQSWLRTIRYGNDVEWVISKLETDDLQWVSTPFGEHFWIAPAITNGLKLSPGLVPWWWEGREAPKPSLEALRGGPPQESHVFIDRLNDINVYRYLERFYASVLTEDTEIGCKAEGNGGDITVNCENALPGYLVVKENSWPGWMAWRDGVRIERIKDRWLVVEAPSGTHTYRFRYLPLDALLGVTISTVGLFLTAWFLVRPPTILKGWFAEDDNLARSL
jgi:hypothetical protein